MRPLILGILPLIKGFVHDIESHDIAQVIQFRHMRIVRTSYGIAPGLFKKLKTPLQYLLFHGAAKSSPIIVDTYSPELIRYAITCKSFVRIHGYNPYSGFLLINKVKAPAIYTIVC
jgi:hypothetical protein